jgi:hypothetical protein
VCVRVYTHTHTHTNGICFTFDVTEYFIHQYSEAGWLTKARDMRRSAQISAAIVRALNLSAILSPRVLRHVSYSTMPLSHYLCTASSRKHMKALS